MLNKLIFLFFPLSLLAQNQTLSYSKGTYQENYRTLENVTIDGLSFDLANQKLIAINDTGGIDEYLEEGDGTRFLSVDPLAPSYPELTPYQFAGNKPIDAIDLDGLEPLTIIDKNGKLTQPVLKMLNALFRYEETTMKNVTFPQNAPSNVFAETISSTIIKTNPNSSNGKSENSWIRTISHELRHVEQYLEAPFELYSDIVYQFDKLLNGYKGTKDELEAFAIGDIATEFTKLHNPEKILRDKILTENQKTNLLLVEVYKFKYNKLLATKQELNTQLNNTKDEKLKTQLFNKISFEIDPKLVEYEENIDKYSRSNE